MKRHITIPRLGSPRIDRELVERVIKARKARGMDETHWATDRRGRPVRIERRSDADLYERMMAAKGLNVRVGAV